MKPITYIEVWTRAPQGQNASTMISFHRENHDEKQYIFTSLFGARRVQKVIDKTCTLTRFDFVPWGCVVAIYRPKPRETKEALKWSSLGTFARHMRDLRSEQGNEDGVAYWQRKMDYCAERYRRAME